MVLLQRRSSASGTPRVHKLARISAIALAFLFAAPAFAQQPELDALAARVAEDLKEVAQGTRVDLRLRWARKGFVATRSFSGQSVGRSPQHSLAGRFRGVDRPTRLGGKTTPNPSHKPQRSSCCALGKRTGRGPGYTCRSFGKNRQFPHRKNRDSRLRRTQEASRICQEDCPNQRNGRASE